MASYWLVVTINDGREQTQKREEEREREFDVGRRRISSFLLFSAFVDGRA